ncbi:hypothetical protein PMAYCL1PPCAC_12763, partial [Pristionchus mayeri]
TDYMVLVLEGGVARLTPISQLEEEEIKRQLSKTEFEPSDGATKRDLQRMLHRACRMEEVSGNYVLLIEEVEAEDVENGEGGTARGEEIRM